MINIGTLLDDSLAIIRIYDSPKLRFHFEEDDHNYNMDVYISKHYPISKCSSTSFYDLSKFYPRACSSVIFKRLTFQMRLIYYDNLNSLMHCFL